MPQLRGQDTTPHTPASLSLSLSLTRPHDAVAVEPNFGPPAGVRRLFWATEGEPGLGRVVEMMRQELSEPRREAWHGMAVPGARLAVAGYDGHGRAFLNFLGQTWWLALLTAALPTWRLFARRRHRRAGVCRRCGYDMRATPELCPECGTTAAA